jgi:hypothetical protein
MRKKNLLNSSGFFYFSMLIFVVICQSLAIGAIAQAATLKNEKMYSIGFRNEPILKVFAKIEAISDFRFSYSPEDIIDVQPIEIAKKKRNIFLVL